MEIYMMNNREPFNKMETLHGEFYENALKYPERIALIYENEKVSYKMLRLYALRHLGGKGFETLGRFGRK